MAENGYKIEIGTREFESMIQTSTAPTASGSSHHSSNDPPPGVVYTASTNHFAESTAGSGRTAFSEGGGAMPVFPGGEVHDERIDTLDDLLDAYLERLDGKSLVSARSHFNKWVRPALGDLPLGLVDARRVELLHASIPPKRTANSTVDYLHAAFRCAERWGLIPRGSNPAADRGEYKHRERPRTRILNDDERAQMWAELRNWEESGRPARVLCSQAIQFLAVTGLRKGEIIGLPRAEIALEAQIPTAYIENTKTGEPKHVYLSPATVDLVQRIETEGNLFPWKTTRSLDLAWRELRKVCGFPDAVLHDLRRTYWSLVGEAGVSVEDACATSGHRDMRVHVKHYRQVSDKRKAEIAAIGADAMVN